MDVYELESELVLINLFNFKLNLTNEFNKCNILDENNNIIGFIEKKVIGYANGNPKIGIYTEFITDDMIYKNIREIKYNNINSYKYSIAKRNNDGSLYYVDLNLGKIKEISFKYNKDLAVLRMKNNELYLNFSDFDNNHKYKEMLIINSSNKENSNKRYEYKISFVDGLGNKTIKSIVGNELYHYFIPSIGEVNDFSFKLNIREVVNGRMIINDYYEYNDLKITDLIISCWESLDMFERFRKLANNILPFKKEVFSYIFNISYLPLEFSIFFSNDSISHLKKLKNKN